jgi:hypothetical protein
MAFESTTVAFHGIKPAAVAVQHSYTKWKNFRACPKRHFHYDLAKDVREEPDEGLKEGFALHEAMAARVQKGTPLPPLLREYEPYAEAFLKGTSASTIIAVELKLAIDKDFNPVGFFDKKVWFRGVADAVKIEGPVAVNWDWKTGKVKEDYMQILTAASCLFAKYPQLQLIQNEFIWVNHARRSPKKLSRAELPEMWAGLMKSDVEPYEEATRTQTWVPKKNGLCKSYCAVETCQFHGG